MFKKSIIRKVKRKTIKIRAFYGFIVVNRSLWLNDRFTVVFY